MMTWIGTRTDPYLTFDAYAGNLKAEETSRLFSAFLLLLLLYLYYYDVLQKAMQFGKTGI